MLPLAFTSNKQAIRQLWDKPIIAEFSQRIQKNLDYFGLPGPDICDFLDWRPYLGRKTGVEYLSRKESENTDHRRKINELQTNIMLHNLSDDWELRCGQIEDVILEGVDIHGKKPALLSLENRVPKMIYDLHNWDFQGGLYKNKNKEAKRIRAIEKCIGLQKGHHFLFLLTLNVRHTLGEELSVYLNGAAEDITSTKHKQVLEWYSARSTADNTEHFRIKAVVSLFVRQIAHVYSFDCFCYPPLYYQGWREHLLHFVFELAPKGTVLPAFSKQDTGAVIDLPLIKVQDGSFFLHLEQQHPGFTEEVLEPVFHRVQSIATLLNKG